MNRFIWLVVLLIVLVACATPTPPPVQPTPTATKPQVIITAPISSMQYWAGTNISINSTSSDAHGIVRVELLVDGQSIRSDPIPSGKSQPHFQVVQTWKATPGTHTIVVRATNETGATADAALSLVVVEPTPVPTRTPYISPTRPPIAVIATNTPAPIRIATPSVPAPTAPAPTLAVAPTAMQYTFTVNEEQFNKVANDALAPRVIWSADSATVKLQDNQIAISANYYPPNIKPSISRVVLAASAKNCKLSIAVVGATFGYSALPETQQTDLSQSVEQILAYQLAQQRNYTCVDSVTVGGGVMTIKYH